MKAQWTNTATEHLLAIYEYIARDSPVYAKRMVDTLTKSSIQISDFPSSGRMVPEYSSDNIREMIVNPYRIIYKIKPEQIDILAVVHCARLLPDDI